MKFNDFVNLMIYFYSGLIRQINSNPVVSLPQVPTKKEALGPTSTVGRRPVRPLGQGPKGPIAQL